MKNTYTAIGLMSGTSLDGLDIAHCTFTFSGNDIDFTIDEAETLAYPSEWIDRLTHLPAATALDFSVANTDYGHYTGRLCKEFMDRNGLKPDLIGSHGHTIFHDPTQGFTVQIGSGAAIVSETGVPVVCDFRSLDVALGGQGAPLVPIGDMLLFGEYDACLNIGGFSNISYDLMGTRIAYDISPANIVLNHYARLLGKAYDESGTIARSGKLIPELFEKLNQIEYYFRTGPKSLGREWIDQTLLPISDAWIAQPADVLATLAQHIAFQIAAHLPSDKGKKVLATGGGVFNTFFMECLSNYAQCSLVIPDKILVEYKEALIFALLGVLRFRGEVNCLKNVTGARVNNIGGALWLPTEII